VRKTERKLLSEFHEIVMSALDLFDLVPRFEGDLEQAAWALVRGSTALFHGLLMPYALNPDIEQEHNFVIGSDSWTLPEISFMALADSLFLYSSA